MSNNSKPEPIEAATVRVFLCDFCGEVHMAMLDLDGDVIAGASMPVELAKELSDNILNAISFVSDRGTMQ
jgi:hypothetical protein